MNEMQTTKTVTYSVGTHEVKISPNMIKNYLVNGGGVVSDQEVLMFLKLCQGQKLDPFMKEAYLIKYAGNAPATMVISKDVFNKRAEAEKDFDGVEAGLIVLDQNGQVVNKSGAFYQRGVESILGAWAKVHRKTRAIPLYIEINYNEYEGRKKDGTPNNQWATKPATMIIKVAKSQALREAFPTAMHGMYTEDEMGINIENNNDIPTIIDAKTEDYREVVNENQLKKEDAILEAESMRQNVIDENEAPPF